MPCAKILPIAGRARKGPAPVRKTISGSTLATETCPSQLNLEIPPYEFNDADGKLIIG